VVDQHVQPPDPFPAWIKLTAGKWQLRDFCVINLECLKSLGAHCYSNHVFYVDKNLWIAPVAESYDNNRFSEQPHNGNG
jgi:hypothetical protein